MLKVYDQDGLVFAVDRIRNESFKGFPNGDRIKILGKKFGKDSGSYVKYNWMNHHDSVQFSDDILDIKVQTPIGNILFRSRQSIDKMFNEGFLEHESPRNAMSNEAKTYIKLNKAGFPTFECLNDKFPYVTGALITRKIDDARHGIDIIHESDEKAKIRYCNDVAALLRQLHDTGTIWGDAWLGNTMYSQDKLLIYDFNLKPDYSKEPDFLKSKDLVAICLSACYRTQLQPNRIIPGMLESYSPSLEIKGKMLQSFDRRMYHTNLWALAEEKMFLQPIYGMDRIAVGRSLDEIRKNIQRRYSKNV